MIVTTELEKNSETNEIDCLRATEFLVDYLTGELDSALAQKLEEHLQKCEDCMSFFNTYRKTIQTTQSLRFEAIPTEMQERLLDFVKEKKS